MLGLADSKYSLVSDYATTSTPTDVFIAAAKASIEHDRCLDILADSNEVDRDISMNLPSWVLDFTRRQGRFFLCYWEHKDAQSEYDASLTMQLMLPPGMSGKGTRLYDPNVHFLPHGESSHGIALSCVGIEINPLGRLCQALRRRGNSGSRGSSHSMEITPSEDRYEF